MSVIFKLSTSDFKTIKWKTCVFEVGLLGLILEPPNKSRNFVFYVLELLNKDEFVNISTFSKTYCIFRIEKQYLKNRRY